MNPVHTFPPYFSKSHSNIFSHLRQGFPSGLFPSGFLTKILHAFPTSPTRAIFPAHLILLDMITRIIFGGVYKLWEQFSQLLYKWTTVVRYPAGIFPLTTGSGGMGEGHSVFQLIATGSSFLELKRPKREADQSSLASAENNVRSYTFTTSYVFTKPWCLIKYKVN